MTEPLAHLRVLSESYSMNTNMPGLVLKNRCYLLLWMKVQYRHLIPTPVDRTSASAWLYKQPWIACQKIRQNHSMTHIAGN